jgi:hypothetical protein
MTIPHPLPHALVELVAQRFRVIGEPMRIRLLDQPGHSCHRRRAVPMLIATLEMP